MLDPDTLPVLKKGRNLLAFSGGVDSSALFFLLEAAGIAFDVAHVNYRTRGASDTEAAHVCRLANRYAKRCFVHEADAAETNFESDARRIRYAFFDRLIQTHGYDTLITAHQLDDRLEWLLMQLCKGAGLPEMVGMRPLETRTAYTLVRPLLHRSKADLRTWLDTRRLPYFEDESNRDERYTRNRFRYRFAAPMLSKYRKGIEASFRYLESDADSLSPPCEIHEFAEVLLLQNPPERTALMRCIDRRLKQRGYLMRRGDKERLLRENELVIGRRFALSIGTSYTILAPFLKTPMTRSFRERCRTLGIGPAVRPYLFTVPESFASVSAILEDAAPS